VVRIFGDLPAPFLIAAALGDGSEAEFPAAIYEDLERLRRQMADPCGEWRTPPL
jgi:hypothetical protein